MRPTSSVALPLAISLNGQERSDESPPFTFFYIHFGSGAGTAAPPAASPPPVNFTFGELNTDFYYPTSGSLGGEGLVVRGLNRLSGTVDGGAQLIVTIGEVPLEAASGPTCRFGHAVVPAEQVPPDVTYLPLALTRGTHELSLLCLHGAALGHVHDPAVLKCDAHAPFFTVHASVHS